MTSTNDGKDVKSNQTSGPKGKSYYIELYKFLESRLSEGSDAHDRTKHLCVAWCSVHSLCQHSAPSTHTHLLNWLQRHTARAVLQTEWQTPKRKDDRKCLEEAINTFIAHVAETPRDGGSLPWETHLVARGEWFKRVLDKPWDHPVLTLLLNPNGTPPTDDEVLAWLKEERGVTFVVRLHTLVGEKCDDIAVSLTSAVMERARAAFPPVADSEEQTEAFPVENAAPTFADKLKEEAGFTPDVWETLMDIEFVLLHKRDSKRCIALAKQTPLLDAYPLIERLQKRLEVSPREKRLWKNAKEVAILIAQVVIARCMVVQSCAGGARTALYCCARLLARLLGARLPAAAGALAAQALTARHLHTLAQAVDKQLSLTNEEMKPYVCELYVRAITAGMNELERLKLKTEKDTEARLMEKTLASWFVQLGTVLARSDRIACECALTAFSLHPSQKMFERIDAAPPLAPVLTDTNDPKEDTVNSEFGSWASDSRSQTNLVKTSETLNMKHTQNKANILSTAIFNEGEALGLSPELCQDIAVLLSGPRVKTLSWDMDRTLLLENCRAYCEVTHEGTRVLTRELKYLNIDPQQYQHLPEEKDDDENDPYYGIERGYEHLAIVEEPDEIWEDANDPDHAESASSIEKYYLTPRRKKKTKRVPHSSDEDSDPLSFMAEAKKTQKKKERPHSKERSNSRKKKLELVDPLDINVPSSSDTTQMEPKKVPKVKKERKKKEKVPKVIGGKRSSLASLVGIKVKPKKKPKGIATVNSVVTDGDHDSQGRNLLTSLNSESVDPNSINKVPSSDPILNSQEMKMYLGMTKNHSRVPYNMIGNKCSPSHVFERPPNNLTKMQFRPQASNSQSVQSVQQQSLSDYKNAMMKNFKNYPEDVKANLSKLLEFRRLKSQQQRLAQHNIPHTPPRSPAIIRQDIPLQSNINPKSVAIPEIPKSIINKQAEHLAELLRLQNLQKQAKPNESVIQYANKKTPASSSTDLRYRAQQPNASSVKMTDFVNPSYDRLMAEIAERHRGQEAMKPANSLYQPVNLQRPVQYSQKPIQKSLNVLTPGQRDFQNFIKEYDQAKNMSPQAIDMSSKSTREFKKPVMPVSRVIPVVPKVPKPESNLPHCPKQPSQKKPESSLNTFSRLNYHKTKQNEMKNKIQTPKSSTYQEVSSELDEIIKKHQRAQMNVIQSRRETVGRLSKPANVQEPVNKLDSTITMGHPLLSNLLQYPGSNISHCQNERSIKSNPVRETPLAPPKKPVSEKDNIDLKLMNLLRQQKLNNSPYYLSNASKPSISTVSMAPSVAGHNPSCQSQQQPSKLPTKGVNSCTSTLETKIIDVISNTQLKPGHHEINKSISVHLKSQPDLSVTKPVKCTVTQDEVKKNVASKDQKKYIPESSKPEWQAVMSDLLRHKTPTRGPNALDVALNKSSFESAFEKSLKEAETYSQNQAMQNDMVPINHHGDAEHPQPVIASIQNLIVTKKGPKLHNEDSKPLKDAPAVPKPYLKQPIIVINEKLKLQITPGTTKKIPQEVQRKQFTYTGPKVVDPFISGIPNSDYDLLEELMDDDLRKEIGELSSDDESYNAAAQSFLKPTKNQASSEKRVSVQFNKGLNEPATTLAENIGCFNGGQPTNELLRSGTSKIVTQSANKIVQTPLVGNSLKVQQNTSYKTRLSHCVITSTSQSAPKPISTTSNAQNHAYNNIQKLSGNQVMFDPNIYISAGPQQASIQNVVLVGQELIYGGYTNIQTPVQTIKNLLSNTYIATPVTVYQTQYNGTPISMPVTNDVSCPAVAVEGSVVNNVTQPSYPAVIVQPRTSIADSQISMKTCETIRQEQVTDCFQPNLKLQEENKSIERKVLSEVQDFAITENVDKTRNQETDTIIDVKTKKNTEFDTERLKKKRLAIINRQINHRCEETTIPLTYSSLSIKVETVTEKNDISQASQFSYVSINPIEDKRELSDPSEEEKLLAQIKNNLQDLSDAINEVQSPAKPDSNDSKENKSFSERPCRRIQLRSSNKITCKSSAEKGVLSTSIPKKPKEKLKSEVYDAAAEVCNKANHDKIKEKEINATKRASKRLRNKKSTITTEKKKTLDFQLQDKKAKALSTEKVKSKIETENLEYLDVESELQGLNITKMVTKNKNKQNDQCEALQMATEPSDKKNQDIIPDDLIIQRSSRPDQSLQATEAPKGKEINDAIPEASIAQKVCLSEQSSANAINQRPAKPIEDMKIDVECASEHIRDPDILDAKDPTQVLPDPVSSTEVLITSGDDEQSAKSSDNSANDTINDQNIGDFLEKDNIDLDMTVTCDEMTIPKTSPTFGNVKTARRKPINADKKKNMKVCDVIIDNDVDVTNKNNKEDETRVADSHDIEMTEKIKSCIANVYVEPTPEPWLVNKTSKITTKPDVASNPCSVLPTTTNSADNDDVLILDDDANTTSVLAQKECVNKESSVVKHVNIKVPVVNSIKTRAMAKTSSVTSAKDNVLLTNELTRSSDNKTHTDINTAVDFEDDDIIEITDIPQSDKDNIRIEQLPTDDPTITSVRVSLPNGRNIIATVRDKVHVTYDTLFGHPSIKKALLSEKNFQKRYILNIQQIVTVDQNDPNKILTAEITKIATPDHGKPVETIDLVSDDESSDLPECIETKKQVFVTEFGKFTAPSMDKDLFLKHQNRFSQKPQICLKKVDAQPETKVKIIDKPNNDKNTGRKSATQMEKMDATQSSPNVAQNAATPVIPSQYVTGLMNDIENELAPVATNIPTVIPEVVEINDSSNDSFEQSKTAGKTTTTNETISGLKNVLLKELGFDVRKQASANSLQEEPSNSDDVKIVEETHPRKRSSPRKVLKLSTVPTGKSCPFNDLNEEDKLQINKRKCAIKLTRCDDLVKKYKQNNADAKTRLSAHIDDENIILTDFTSFNDLSENIVESQERSSSPVIELFNVQISLDDKSPAYSASEVDQVTPLSCAANWYSTKTMLRLLRIDNAINVRCSVFENNTNITDDSVDNQAIPQSCEANWLTTKCMLRLQGDNDAAMVQSPVQDDEICNGRLDDQAISTSCEANWLKTKPMLHLQAIDEIALRWSRNIDYDSDICDDCVKDEALPQSVECNQATTNTTLLFQSNNGKPLVRSHVDNDDKMSDGKLTDQTIPLWCEANWLMTKRTLQLQGVNDKAVVPSFKYDKICGEIPDYTEIPLSYQSKSTLSLQDVNNELSPDVTKFDYKICKSVLAHVTPLSCEARWFASKVTLHSEAVSNALLLIRSNVSNDDGSKKQRCSRNSISNMVNGTETIQLQTAPSLVSLVLKGFRNTNVIQQYKLLSKANARSVNVLKRKSTTVRTSAACKVSKLNVISKTKVIDCNYLSTVAIDSSAADVKTISEDILLDTKMVTSLESRPEDKTPKNAICATECDDNHNLNVRDDSEELICEASGRRNEEKAMALDSIISVSTVNTNHELFKSSDIINENSDKNFYSSNERRSVSPVINTSILVAFESESSIKLDKKSSLPLSVIIPTEQLTQKTTDRFLCNNVSTPSLETENLLDKQDHVDDFDDSSKTWTSAEATKSANNSVKNETSVVNNGSVRFGLENKSLILSCTNDIEPNSPIKPDSSDYDDIEVKLAEIVGESLIDNNNKTISLQNNKRANISDGQKSEIIRIILGDEPFIETDGKEIEMSISKDNKSSFFKDSDIQVDDHSKANHGHQDHNYASLGAAAVLGSIDVPFENNHVITYIETDDVMFLSKNELTKDLETEIVDMCSVKIDDDFKSRTKHTNVNSRKLSDQVRGSVNREENISNTTDQNSRSEVTVEEDYVNIASHKVKEKEINQATQVLSENSTTKLTDEVCAESIMNKYLALIRNKSEVLESIVEYEDPETGTCYVIPIIEETSQSDIESFENTEVVTSMTEILEITEKEAKAENVGTSRQNKKHKGNDDIEARLAEIVGESYADNEMTRKRIIRLDEINKSSYSVEVEAISSPEHDIETVACQLKGIADHNSQKTAKSMGAKSTSGADKKRRSKCHHKPKIVDKITDNENFKVILPMHTYSKGKRIQTRLRSLKRKADMSDTKTSERKYRKSKNIDCPKFKNAALSETVYAKEYKNLIDYCSSVQFSFSVPFHKEHIDVHNMLKSWPIRNIHTQKIEQSQEANEDLFAEIEKSETLSDPLAQTLSEEITCEFDTPSYIPSNIHETNFKMGFGERSGRVIQETKDGEYTTFSAATLSDVKQLQPLLPSDQKVTLERKDNIDGKVHDQKFKAKHFVDHLKLREKVRSFFEKTKADLDINWKLSHKKNEFEHDDNMFSWLFGDLTSTRCFRPSPVEIMVNVVQVGQLPVSAAAQNPVTCDPRVTHVSNASPSQCSPGNSMGDELQTTIKTEYTELTTADINLPLMQEYVQHHSMPSESQEPSNLYDANDSSSVATQMSVVKIELMDETSQENDMDYENNGLQQLPNGKGSDSIQYKFENIVDNVATESNSIAAANSLTMLKTAPYSETKQSNDVVEKPDQLAHAMNAAGISAIKALAKSNTSVVTMQQNPQPNVVISSQANSNNFSKAAPVNSMALQQALSQILPPSLNQTSTPENNPQASTSPQVLHIVQGNNNAQSVINKPNGTQLLHIVQNKSTANSNGTPTPQQNTFGGLSLVDGPMQQSGNQLLHIVNTANQKNTNAGQLLKRVNLLTNLANVQGSNEQKMVQFVCKSADGKSIQLPHQRSMVLRFQPLDPSNVPTIPKQNDNQDHSSISGTTHLVNEKETNQQEMKSRSLYEENYAKFVQNDTKFSQNGDSKLGPEKATSLPKFNQVFGKQIYQEKQNEMDSESLPENSDPPEDDNPPLEQMNDITNPPILIRKPNPSQPSHVQSNLVQHIKQTIGPMNIQTMHGGVIYTRQIPVNIGNGQTINLITVPSTELVDDSIQKQQPDVKFGNQEGDQSIIKLVPTSQLTAIPNGSTEDNNGAIRSTNDANPPTNPQPQPVLTQMRIKLPMLSKAPPMVGATRVVRPSYFQIQRNVIGGANQQVYQQLVLTAAPPMGQSIRLPAQMQKPKTPSESQSSPESQMSSSTLEQLREFDMVLEQVKERSTVQPGSSTSSTNNFSKLKSSPDTSDAPTPSTSTHESNSQVLYSVGNTQPLNMVNYVNRKSTITSTTTTSFVRSPDSTGTVESPSSSTHSHVHTVTSDSCASSSCASEATVTTVVLPKPKKKKPKPSTSNSNPFNIKNTPKPSSQKPLEDEQTTQRILYILAEYKEQVENSPDKDKPAPRRRNNPGAPGAGSSKRKKSGSRRRDMSPVQGEDSCRTMGSEDSSCGTSLGECNECLETHSPEESPKNVVRRLTFEQETQITQTRTTTTTTTIPHRNVIVTDGQAFAVRGPTGKPATTVLMPANYLLPVSMVKGGQQIAIVTNRGPKLLVGAGDGGTGGALLFQRLIGPGGLKPMLARPGVRHIRLPTAAFHNLQAFNIATPTVNIQPPDSTASPAPAPAPPDLVDTRAMSSPWPDRDAGEVKPERENSSPEGSEPWNLPSSSIADDYGYEEIVRTDNMDRTVLDAIPDRYSPDLEAQRIFDKMFDSDSKKSMYDSRCGYDIDASDDDKAYHQVVHRKDGRHTTRLTHVSAAALRHKYAILEQELRLQKSLSEECEDLGVDSPSASELFPEAELLFAPSPAHEQTIDHCHTPQPTIHTQGIPQPDLDDQIATDHLLTHKERHDDLDINLDDVGQIVTVGEDGMTTIPLDHEEFARSHEEFARSHPNTTFHSEPEDGEVPPFTIAQSIKGRQITFHSRSVPGTVVMAPQTTVISQATIEANGSQNPVKFSDIDNMINAMPTPQNAHINMPSVLKENNEGLTKFDRLLNESREQNLTNTASAIVHSTGNGTQVIRRVQYERRDSRYLVEDDAMIAGESKVDERRDMIDDTSSSERHPELFWDTQPRPERKRFDFSSDSDKCCKSPYDETNSDSSGIGAHMRLDSVIKAARTERSRSDGSSAEDCHPPLRTYPPKRTYQHTHHSHHHEADRSVTGKTRATDRCHDVKDESRRRASNRGVVKRGCHCCNGSTPPKPKKSRPKKTSDYPHN